MGRNVFEESSPEQWPILCAQIRWIRTPDNERKAAVPGSVIQRQSILLSPPKDNPRTGARTTHQFAATCAFGAETDEGQIVDLSFWFTVDVAELGLPGTDLVLLEGDEAIATGSVI